MSRFLLLLVFVLWMSPAPVDSLPPGHGAALAFACFLGVYCALVLVMGAWSRSVARRTHRSDLQRSLRRFNRMMYFARLMIPGWFAVGVYALGWKALVDRGINHTALANIHFDLPSLMMGSLPALAAWMGLWWAQYPADRALREQSLLIQLDENLPAHAPPGFWDYFAVHFRLQLLFTVAPVILLVLLRDVLSLFLPPLLERVSWLHGRDSIIQSMISLPSFALIFVLGPEILRRVLRTEPMPDGPLRQRLEAICKRNGIGYRNVLVWHTSHHMGNAAVMGFIPQVRYILLSDLLLETMNHEQIEAVFAHEVGHVMHKHMFWLVASMSALMLAFAGPGQVLADAMDAIHWRWFPESLQIVLLLSGGVGLFWLVFGFISRNCERQADVFAARTIQNSHEIADLLTPPDEARGLHPNYTSPTYVGRHGAQIFCSALERVAIVNNIPIAARSWCHGSIAKRMRFLNELGQSPAKTADFDRGMTRIYISVILALCAFGAWAMVELVRQS